MQVKYRYKMKIPHIGGQPVSKSDHNRMIEEGFRKTAHLAALKPDRSLGAPWISDFVALRKNVNLCENCWRKYSDWWKRHGYRAHWNDKKLSDCDGCGGQLIFVTGFYPEERFSSSVPHLH